MKSIDIHTHFIPPAYLDWVRKNGVKHDRELVEKPGADLVMLADNRSIPIPAGFYDVEQKLVDMNAQGVDCQVVSPPPFLLHYDLAADLASDLACLFNDEAAALARRNPGQFLPMATLPMQDMTRTIAELQRVAAGGVRAIEIGASVDGKELDDPGLAPFWEAVENLGMLVFIHPVAPPGRARMNDYHLFNLIGFLAESTLAIGRLIFAGVLDRHPDLKICLAHAGGMFPWIAGRFDHGYETIAACRERAVQKPSDYLGRLLYDSISHDPQGLDFLVEKVGASRILMGTDYPFRIGDTNPIGSVNAAKRFDENDRMAVIGGNAASLLGLPIG